MLWSRSSATRQQDRTPSPQDSHPKGRRGASLAVKAWSNDPRSTVFAHERGRALRRSAAATAVGTRVVMPQ